MAHRAIRKLFLLSCLVAPLAALAQGYPNTSFMGVEFDKNASWYQRCMAVEHAMPSAADLTSGPAKQGCRATDLYYDTKAKAAPSAADWDQVRACAFNRKDETVLMMLYANGYGVARNPDLATRYACSLDQVAFAEMESRIEHLSHLGKQATPFDFCDDITSGVSGAVCASINAGQHERARTARFERYAAALPAAAKPVFARLLRAQAAFSKASADNETDMQGTAAAGFAIDAGDKLDRQFLEDVTAIDAGKLPRFSAADFAKLDAELNHAYQDVIAAPSKQEDEPERIGYSTVTRTNVRTTQRAWLKYRDAWAAFVVAKAAPIDPVSIQALLTQRRTKQLARIPF